jgi:cob(I)alamin adenosyltransferase
VKVKFYTATCDDGYTGLLGEGRVPKNDRKMEAIGALDEANAALGMVRAVSVPEVEKQTILRIQRDLYTLMSEVAATPATVQRFRVIGAEKVTWLEVNIDRLSAQVQIPKEFIIPGDTANGALVDLARTIVRRAERRLADLFFEKELENIHLLRYLNRLSSFLFVFEIHQNIYGGVEKISMAKERKTE